MRPRQKAIELVAKFEIEYSDFTFINGAGGIDSESGYLTKYSAKQCALIAVEELLEHCGGDIAQKFWNSVKTEIINL